MLGGGGAAWARDEEGGRGRSPPGAGKAHPHDKPTCMNMSHREVKMPHPAITYE